MKNIIQLLIILILFSSCLGSKKVFENNTSKKEVEKLEVRKDSSNVIEKNRAINDKVITTVVSSGNKETDKKIDEILSKLNTQKNSGSNSYKQYYDSETRQLVTDFFLAQTQDQILSTKNDSVKETSTEEVIDTYISKKVTAIPWWLWFIAGLYLLPTIFNRLPMIINPIVTLIKKYI
jgi:hypothetical protein